MRLRRDPKRRRHSLRCLLGRHAEPKVEHWTQHASPWHVTVEACSRCWRPIEVNARNVLRRK